MPIVASNGEGSPSGRVGVCVEVTPRQTVASALEWPGWTRAGRSEADALETLAGYASRYAAVAEQAGHRLPNAPTFDIVERVPGGSATAFAAPECRRPFPQIITQADRSAPTPEEATRLVALVIAAWATFDRVVAASPVELRKGPRGGGRDLDEIIEHVVRVDTTYARTLGVTLRRPAIDDRPATEQLRKAVSEVLGSPSNHPTSWPPRYAARRIAWHILEHTWETQDRA